MPVKPETVDQYLKAGCGRCQFGGTPQCKVHGWVDELRSLRAVLLASELTEVIKWNAPCYTFRGKNILTLTALRDSVVISFFRGAQLADPEHILEKPGENSRFARYMRFTDPARIEALKGVILAYIQEAVHIAQARAKAVETAAPDYPDELTAAFKKNPELENAFSALTPGRRRGYLIHFNSAKQSQTRAKRIEKCMPGIIGGKGWHEP